MKQYLISLFIILSLNAFSQQPYNKVKYYFGDSINSDAIVRTICRLDTNYVILLHGDTIGGAFYRIQAMKIDKFGNEIKTFNISDDSIAFPSYAGQAMIIDDSFNIIIATNKWHHTTTNFYDGYIIKLTKDLDTIWTKTYDIPANLIGCQGVANPNNIFTAIRETKDKNYIISALYNMNCNFGSIHRRAYLQKIDTSGNVLWRKIYTNVSPIYDIEVTEDSGFVFTGVENNSVKFFKTDKNGNIIWSKVVNHNAYPHNPFSTCILDSNTILSLSAYWEKSDFVNSQSSLTVSKIDIPSQSKTWEKNFKIFFDLDQPGIHQNIKAINVGNREAVIAGTARAFAWDSTAGYHGFLFKLNSNGDSLWAHNYNGKVIEEYNQINDIVLADDGGFFFAGYNGPADNSYNIGAWLVKTDSMGNAPNMHTIGFENSKFESSMFNVFPNPATDLIKIEFNSQKSNISSYKIYNSQGKLLLSEKVLAKDFTINIKEFASGVYFIEATTSSGERVMEKFVKE